jgi:DNA-binding response OmpR family regulator
MSYRILVVESSPAIAVLADRALSGARHRVAIVHTFEQATHQIALDCPDLLVTAIRLGAFNGLHLLLRLRAEHEEVPVIVMGHPSDATRDISRYDGCFVPTPLDSAALVSTVSQLLAGREPRDPRNERRWPRKVAGLQATVHDLDARVVELSYGGLRLEMREAPEEEPGPVDIRFPSLGLSVTAVLRWSKPLECGEAWCCGAEIAIPGTDETGTWRWIVDSLN